MTLEPTKHGHGGGEPDIKKLHKIFLTIRFIRLIIAGVAGYMITDSITSTIAISMLDTPIEVKIWNTIAITSDTIFYLNIVIAGFMSLFFIMILKGFAKRYRQVKFAHLAYCKCDRKRWYNRE